MIINDMLGFIFRNVFYLRMYFLFLFFIIIFLRVCVCGNLRAVCGLCALVMFQLVVVVFVVNKRI